jgi:UDP-3-O-[3-hydroxymyristoyl] N-acetylglucosamine deacetylase
LPAPVHTGIVFIRKDLPGTPEIQATIKNIRPSLLSTTVGVRGAEVQTTEHVLAAVGGLCIDNLIIEVDAPELPVLDGSAAPFVDMILQAGVVQQDNHRSYIKIIRPIEVKDGDKHLTVRPAFTPSVMYTIDYNHPLIQQQTFAYAGTSEGFVREIAPARTFGFLREVEALWRAGLGLGGSLHNTLILSEDGLLNEDGLRFRDEFVRHKILDLIGDLMLLGMPVIGETVAVRSGHALHARLVSKILESRANWVIVSEETPIPAGRMRNLHTSLVASPQRD